MTYPEGQQIVSYPAGSYEGLSLGVNGVASIFYQRLSKHDLTNKNISYNTIL